MRTVLCTLYNSLYLDKGLVLYDSLCNCAKDFKLYVLCMDDKCYDVLEELNQEYHIPIRLSDFENGDSALLEAKSSRKFGEYCWTCSSSLIRYILLQYCEENCTYIDADMYFYQDPGILLDEMRRAGKMVMITPHRFTPDKMNLLIGGKYCVEFNTFLNEENSLALLEKWRSQCLECCTSVFDGVHFGDQKYLDTWLEDYPEVVHECQNSGAGIAPWNIGWYKLIDAVKNIVLFKKDNTSIPIVFYHFHHVTYESRRVIRTGIMEGQADVDYELVRSIYTAYLEKNELKKRLLKTRYGINTVIKEHPAYAKEPKWKSVLKEIGLIRNIYRKIFAKKGNRQFVIYLQS